MAAGWNRLSSCPLRHLLYGIPTTPLRSQTIQECVLRRSSRIPLSALRLSTTATLKAANTVEGSHTASKAVSLSDDCVKRLLEVAKEEPNTLLRVTVHGGGCSGFQYKFNLDTKVLSDDKVFEREGARVVVDELSLGYLEGSTIDYHKELIRASFRIISNPNADTSCSCGVSFALK